MGQAPKNKPAANRFVGFETIPIPVHIRVGEATCKLGQLTHLNHGDVLPIDRRIGEPFDLRAGETLLGRVEPVAGKNGVAVKLVDVPREGDANGG